MSSAKSETIISSLFLKALCGTAVSASSSSSGVFAAASLRTAQTSAADAQCHIALENADNTGFLKQSDGAYSGYIRLSARAACAFLKTLLSLYSFRPKKLL